MIQLLLTEEQQRVINEAIEPVEIVDRSGRVFTTTTHGFTAMEMHAIAKEGKNFRPQGTLRELLDRLKTTIRSSQNENSRGDSMN